MRRDQTTTRFDTPTHYHRHTNRHKNGGTIQRQQGSTTKGIPPPLSTGNKASHPLSIYTTTIRGYNRVYSLQLPHHAPRRNNTSNTNHYRRRHFHNPRTKRTRNSLYPIRTKQDHRRRPTKTYLPLRHPRLTRPDRVRISKPHPSITPTKRTHLNATRLYRRQHARRGKHPRLFNDLPQGATILQNTKSGSVLPFPPNHATYTPRGHRTHHRVQGTQRNPRTRVTTRRQHHGRQRRTIFHHQSTRYAIRQTTTRRRSPIFRGYDPRFTGSAPQCTG